LYKLAVSLRYLRSKKINFFSISGVAVGVMVLIVVLSVMGGFIREMRLRIRGTLSDIIVERRDIFGFIGYEQTIERLKRLKHVVACSPHLEGLALIRMRNIRRWAYFRGIDPEAEVQVGDFAKYVGVFDEKNEFRATGVPESFKMGCDPSGPWPIIVGRELLDVGDGNKGMPVYVPVGETVVVYTLAHVDEHSLKRFRLVGVFKSGMYEFDSTMMYMPLDLAQRFRKATSPKMITSLNIKLDDYRYAQQACREIKKLLGPAFRVMTWEEKRRPFLRAIALEKRVMAVILFFIIIVAGFMILSILTMIVIEKTKDIGILMSLGATVRGVMSIFLMNGLIIGVVGGLLGGALGVMMTFWLNPIADLVYRLTGFRVFPRDIYYLDKIPTELNPLSIAVTVCVAIGVSFAASIYPAWRAAKMDPVEALRYE